MYHVECPTLEVVPLALPLHHLRHHNRRNTRRVIVVRQSVRAASIGGWRLEPNSRSRTVSAGRTAPTRQAGPFRLGTPQQYPENGLPSLWGLHEHSGARLFDQVGRYGPLLCF